MAVALAWPRLFTGCDSRADSLLGSWKAEVCICTSFVVDWDISQDGRRKLQLARLRKGGERKAESKLHWGGVV